MFQLLNYFQISKTSSIWIVFCPLITSPNLKVKLVNSGNKAFFFKTIVFKNVFKFQLKLQNRFVNYKENKKLELVTCVIMLDLSW